MESRPGSAPAELVARVVASEDAIAHAAAELVLLDGGHAFRQPEFPYVFDANLIRRPRLLGRDLDCELLELSQPFRAIGAYHLRLSFDAAPLRAELHSELAQRGFDCQRLLVMALPGRPARNPRPEIRLRPVTAGDPRSFAGYRQVLDGLNRDEAWYTSEVARQIAGSIAAKAKGGAYQLQLALCDGAVVGSAGLAIGRGPAAGVAAIEAVGTLPEARGRGVAQTLVVSLAEMARRAGCDVVYLITEADDTPKQLYRKLGFETLFPFEIWQRLPERPE